MPDTTPKTQEEQGQWRVSSERADSMYVVLETQANSDVAFTWTRKYADQIVADHNAAKSLETAMAALREIATRPRMTTATGKYRPYKKRLEAVEALASTALREMGEG
jgi:hypothetical protein